MTSLKDKLQELQKVPSTEGGKMAKKNKKSSHITIDGEDYEMINVVSNNGELVASITSKNIIEKNGFEVRLIKDSTKIRFKEID